MKKVFFLCLMFIFTTQVVSAADKRESSILGNISNYSSISFVNGEPFSEEKITRPGVVYNFSDKLIKAASSCSPYEEDFSQNNKKEFSHGNVLVQIKGKTRDGNCKFKTQFINYYWPGTTSYS